MTPTTADAYHLLHQGSLALARVERNGIRIDMDRLQESIETTTKRIKEQETILKADPIYRKWKRRFGEKTKLGAPEQLAKIVYEELGYKATRYTKGSYNSDGTLREENERKASTDKHALESVDLPFVKEYLRYKSLLKVRSTYLNGLLKEVVDGHIHPTFHLHTVRTYRGSCSDPNGQNIPTRDGEQAELVRSCIVPELGHRIVEFDFKGAEVTVSACYNKDSNLLDYCKDKTKDMHLDMAVKCYMLKPSQVSKQVRYCAKNMFVFPQFYGSVYFQCAPALWEAMVRLQLETKDGVPLREHLAKKGITELGACDPKQHPRSKTFEAHIKKVEEYYWGQLYPEYARWKKQWYEQYRRTGSFTMLTGFQVHGLYSRNEVLNYPVQGSAFHCLLWCLIQIDRWLRKHKMKSRIIGQIHDSLLMSVAEDEYTAVLSYCRHVMTVLLPRAWKWLIVPISVEVEATEIDGSWYTKKPVEI